MTETHACPHCDSTDSHVHLDSAEHARTRRSRLLSLIGSRLGLLIAAAAALAVLAPSTWWLVGAGLGLVAWVVVTGAGVVAGSVSAARTSRLRALMIGALSAAALTPLAALALALVRGSVDPWFAGAAAVGFFAGAAGAEALRMWRLRALFGQDTRAGEIARDAAALTRDRDNDAGDLAWTALQAVLVGGWVLLCALLPVLAIVLVPLHVAAVTLIRRQALVRSAGTQAGPKGQRLAS